MNNAVILAAGKSSRFAPFTYEKPKGLFRVKGEILIERQIEQLMNAGVKEIIVVVGYMKEKFFYLEQKYPGLRLLVNNEFGKKGNLFSLYKAKEYLNNTFVCCADHYFVDNPFSSEEFESYYSVTKAYGPTKEWCVYGNPINKVIIGGENRLVMMGHSF